MPNKHEARGRDVGGGEHCAQTLSPTICETLLALESTVFAKDKADFAVYFQARDLHFV
jgi:hypothetical protein